jgi:hypothetical protein
MFAATGTWFPPRGRSGFWSRSHLYDVVETKIAGEVYDSGVIERSGGPTKASKVGLRLLGADGAKIDHAALTQKRLWLVMIIPCCSGQAEATRGASWHEMAVNRTASERLD